MFENNDQWKEFKAALEARGVRITYAWQVRRDGKKPKYPRQCSDVAQVCFIASGFQPSVLTAIVIDYGKGQGFALYTEEGDHTITADVDRIAKPARHTEEPR